MKLIAFRTFIACFVVPVALTLASVSAEDLPPIGLIELYGFRTVPPGEAREALGLNEGDSGSRETARKALLEQRLEKLPGVAHAQLTWVCCHQGKTVLFVGIQENAVPQLKFRSAPTGRGLLPPEAIELNRRFDAALQAAVLKGETADDVSQGHSLLANPECRAIQEQFITYAGAHLNILRSVLRESSDGQQRADAAWILGYAPNKRFVVPDLLYAIEDPDSEVRNNATRALGAIASLAAQHRELHIEIPPTRFIEMLNSLEWSDRNKAVFVLAALTLDRPPEVLQELRQRALPALVEMARWKSHGLGAFMLLGRIAGVDEKAIQEIWAHGEQESVIAKWAARAESESAKP